MAVRAQKLNFILFQKLHCQPPGFAFYKEIAGSLHQNRKQCQFLGDAVGVKRADVPVDMGNNRNKLLLVINICQLHIHPLCPEGIGHFYQNALRSGNCQLLQNFRIAHSVIEIYLCTQPQFG